MAPVRRKNSDRMKRKEETVMKSLGFEQGHSLEDYLIKDERWSANSYKE